MSTLQKLSALARTASAALRNTPEKVRNGVLLDFASALEEHAAEVLSQNQLDTEEAAEGGMSASLLDRLSLSPQRISQMAEGIRQTAALPDPLGRVLEERTLRSGVHLTKVTVPMGVIGVIFESRPNVSADCAALCLKAGSSCLLKGGKESYRSCKAITDLIRNVLTAHGLDPNAVVLAEPVSHEELQAFMEDRNAVDLLIPRGGRRLIESVVSHARVPVIETGAGVCHVFVNADADFDMARRIILNAKCSRPSVCNAMETLLVHQDIARNFIPLIVRDLEEKGVVIYADEKSRALMPSLREASEKSWSTEYDDLFMNLRQVKNTEEAVRHINTYGTHHSETIVTENEKDAEYFLTHTDSACVYQNASTRFTDGFEFGMGAEIGISTQKLHARGPMGLQELTTYMYRLRGKGEIR